MSDFKRRDFLKTAAGVAAGTAMGASGLILPADVAAQTYKITPEKGAKLRVLALEAIRAGRRGRLGCTHQEVHRTDRHRCARRRRRLGGRAAQGRGRGQRRQRAGHHHQHHGGRAPVSGKTGRRQRSRQLPRQQVRRLVRLGQSVRDAQQEVGGDHDGRRRQRHRLSRQPRQGGGIRQGAARHGRFPEAVPGAQGQGNTCGIRARQRHRRLELDLLAALGARREDGRRRRTTSSSTARRPSPRSNTRSSSTKRSFRARCRGSTRTTTRRSSTAS